MTIIIKPANHGGDTRGQAAGAAGFALGRFGRMFPGTGDLDRPQHDDKVLTDLAEVMTGHWPVPAGGTAPEVDDGKPIKDIPASGGSPAVAASDAGDENPTIPAGYTYFGQFVDHDISFDPTPLHGRTVDIDAEDDFRSPALDLDSVYGAGPENQKFLYTFAGDGLARLRTGADLGMAAFTGMISQHDHLRLPAEDASGSSSAAVIGDKRNDENKIVAQVHQVFVALHNKLIGDVAALKRMGGDFDEHDADERFRRTVKAVRWHYQWVVLHDYVANRLCEPQALENVLNAGGAPRIGHYMECGPRYPYMPIEFSVAAFRIGHSMVRPTYALNTFIGSPGGPMADKRVPIFMPGGGPTQAMNGFGQEIPGAWGIDWSFFLDGMPTMPQAAGFAIPQPSYRIDATLVDPLRELPEFAGNPEVAARNLAARNLLRGRLAGLPSGEAVAKALGQKVIGFDALWWAGSQHPPHAHPDRTEIAAARRAYGDHHKAAIQGRTPLWYYILREAEICGTQRHPADPPFGGQHLGPVGSRIVAETFVGLLWLDRSSFLHSQTTFRPVLKGGALLPPGDTFDLGDLVRYALS